MSNKKDYIIFEKAPKLTILYDEATYPFDSGFTNINRNTEKPKVPGTVTISDCSDDLKLNNVEIEYVRVRGNYTTNYRKKPLKIKFTEKQAVLGLNNNKKAKEGILLADYGDNAMSRNALAFYLGQQLLKTQWSPTFTYVHVYANENYLGLYLLCDQKETGKNRVNINEPEKNYTGVDIGYFFERDDYYRPDGEDPGFIIHQSNPTSEYLPNTLPGVDNETNKYYGIGAPSRYRDGHTIHSKIYSQDQSEFLKSYMCLIYTVLYEACINNAAYELSSTDINDGQNGALIPSTLTPKEAVEKVIDLDSFLNMYLINEIAGNPDLAHSSFYFCLDASAEGNKKLALTCPGDGDRAFGLCDGLQDASRNTLGAKDAFHNPGVALLPHTSGFIEMLEARWQEMYDKGILYKALAILDDYSTTYSSEFAKNFEKYSIKGEGDPGTTNPRVAASIRLEFYENVETQADTKTLLRDWVNERFIALHTLFNGHGSTDWPAPPPEPEPTDDPTIFRKDKLVKAFTQEEWNEKYNNAASQADELTKLGNQLYAHPSNAAVIMYNKMYAAVASGKKLTDPELQADLRAGNANAAR